MSINKADSLDGKVNEHKGFRTMYHSAALVVGQFVMINTADTENGLGYTVILSNSTTAQNRGLICGVCAATDVDYAGTPVTTGYARIQVRGKYENAYVEGSTVAGDILVAHTVPGQAIPITGLDPDYGQGVAVALETDSGNYADVMLTDPFNLAQS